MRVTFLTEGTLAPSSRFRVQQFLPYFERAGIRCRVISGYGDAYNRIAATPLGAPYKLAARSRRLLGGLTASNADVLFIQRPILPFSAAPETILQRINPRIVFDVDDAVFLGPRGDAAPTRQRVFESAVKHSAHYIAGNRYLAEAGHALSKTTVIPTVIDTDRYEPSKEAKTSRDAVVIGWIGSATTLWHLDEILEALRTIRTRHANVVVRIVGPFMPEHLKHEERFEFVPWSAATEIASLQQFDIGVMPLADLPVSLGKCGFKMIQYMAVGIPVVTSPVGANVEIIGDQQAGKLASTQREWVEALEAFVSSPTLRGEAGKAARARAVAHYSIHAVLPVYISLFESVASVGR